MSDVSQGPGWWLASDGKWYPPKESEEPPGPGWWLASDGKWYPPESRTTPKTPGTAASPRTAPTGQPATAAGTEAGGSAGKASTGRKQTATARAAVPAAKQAGSASKKVAASKNAASKKPSSAARKSSASTPSPSRQASQPNNPTPTRTAPARTAPARAGAGLTPQAQIAQRNQASRADALVMASKRANAASRALAVLSTELDKGRERAIESTDPLGSLALASPAPTEDAIKAKPAPPSKPTSVVGTLETRTPTAKAAGQKTTGTLATTSSSGAPTGDTSVRKPDAGEQPLLELKPSALSGDLSRAGERLVIFSDRVETIDRAGQIRETIEGTAIADVVIQKRITGLVLSIEDVNGPVITIKGLTAPQAEQARALIMRKTRQFESPPGRAKTRPAPRHPEPPVPDAAPSRTWLIEVDEADLLRKLADLHRAGVLTDDEFRDKVGLIHRIVNGETTSATKR